VKAVKEKRFFGLLDQQNFWRKSQAKVSAPNLYKRAKNNNALSVPEVNPT